MEANRPSASHTTHTAPKNIACVSIDTSASCAERIKQYVEQVGDPVLLYGQRHCGEACVFQHRYKPARPPAAYACSLS